MERGSESASKEVYILPGSYIIVPCVKHPGVGMPRVSLLLSSFPPSAHTWNSFVYLGSFFFPLQRASFS
jgi:hypothetical protein